MLFLCASYLCVCMWVGVANPPPGTWRSPHLLLFRLIYCSIRTPVHRPHVSRLNSCGNESGHSVFSSFWVTFSSVYFASCVKRANVCVLSWDRKCQLDNSATWLHNLHLQPSAYRQPNYFAINSHSNHLPVFASASGSKLKMKRHTDDLINKRSVILSYVYF